MIEVLIILMLLAIIVGLAQQLRTNQRKLERSEATIVKRETSICYLLHDLGTAQGEVKELEERIEILVKTIDRASRKTRHYASGRRSDSSPSHRRHQPFIQTESPTRKGDHHGNTKS